MTAAGDLCIWRQGRAGRITLNRPGALNALTHDMVLAMEGALTEWREEEAVALILIDAEGERAFCAGGDIEKLYESGRAGDFGYGRRFWTDEYRLNAMMAEYDKPCIAFMQGLVMGGGVGIGCHVSHRIVSETTRIAMPECGIGLIPDVGGSYLLAQAPRCCGWYLGLTGARMDAGDALHAGFADFYVPEEKWRSLKDLLCETGDASAIASNCEPRPKSELQRDAARMERYFSAGSALESLQMLEADTSQWAKDTAGMIRRGCPLSVACCGELLGMNARVKSVRAALTHELRFTWRSMSDGEFLEGVRAQIIDRDRRPVWRAPRLEDVTTGQIAAMLAPLDAEVAA